MAHLILFDNETREELLPLTYTRPAAALRVGILTIQEKWEKAMGFKASFLTEDYLTEKFGMDYGEENLLINGALMPTPQMLRLITQLESSEALLLNGELLAAKLSGQQIEQLTNDEDFGELIGKDVAGTDILKLTSVHDIFHLNQVAIEADFELITRGRESAPLPPGSTLIGPANRLFIEHSAQINCSILNTEDGPIYIGKDTQIMEGSMIRGAFALCEKAILKMGSKIYGATTLGPNCKAGGEMKNVVMQANSSKAHEGYLGNSVLGEWCNIGADTNSSNLKNNYEPVKLWHYPTSRFKSTGLQFCGLIMGDHSKTAINTMFNTGTVVGICSNIFGTGFPRNFIPSFSWGGPQGFTTYRTEKVMATVERVMARKNLPLEVEDRLIILRVFEETAKYRRWEKKESEPTEKN